MGLEPLLLEVGVAICWVGVAFFWVGVALCWASDDARNSVEVVGVTKPTVVGTEVEGVKTDWPGIFLFDTSFPPPPSWEWVWARVRGMGTGLAGFGRPEGNLSLSSSSAGDMLRLRLRNSRS